MATLVESSNATFSNTVRVIKKYPFSKHLLFLDVITCNSNSTLAIHSIVVKSEDVSSGLESSDDLNVGDIHAGDLLLINGTYDEISEDKYTQLSDAGIWRKTCVFVQKSNGGTIRSVLEWDSKSNGPFSYEEARFLPFNVADINQVSSSCIRVPNLVLQAKNKTSEKALELLRGLYPTVQFRESVTALSSSKDRLILCFEDHQTNSLQATKITSHDLLSQAVSRIYPVCLKTFPSVVNPDLTTALTLLYHQFPTLGLSGPDVIVRVQSYPRHVASQVVNNLPQVHWSPKGFTHVMSVVFVDAVWMVSLVPSEEVNISDIYENSNKFGSKSSSSTATEEEGSGGSNGRVCKSINKLHEIMTRNDWIYDSYPDSSNTRSYHTYGLCLDVGSSPGGWSTYLARHVKVGRVISVDKGVMNVDAALMPPIEHWQMLGQDAVEKLRELSLQEDDEGSSRSYKIDLYCCDANIAPVLSTALLVKCVEYQLMAEGAKFVLTLKNTLGKQKDWSEAKTVCMEMLQRVFEDVHQVSLLANTPRETTVTGVYKLT